MEKWVGQDVPKLGFGLMRLPTLADNTIDLEQVSRMADAFIKAGFTYFDTAYGYHNEQSEPTLRKAVVERYPRESFLVATKMPPWHVKTAEDLPRLFDTQMERTGAGYFDYYMLHALNANTIAKMEEVDAWGFMRKKKEEGLVRYIGCSYHDSAAVLDDLLTKHPELDFVQLQINYADWESDGVQSRLCYETVRKHGKSVIVMEPVKGGALAAMSPQARAAFEARRPDDSVASWALRFAASLDGIVTVLSGMSDMAQMQDNIRTMKDFEPLSDADRQTIEEVRQILAATPTTPCTDCKYCIENDQCPSRIPIPAIIAQDNSRRLYHRVDKGHYRMITGGKGKASDCIRCGNCESRCPQHLPIISLMESCAEIFE